MIKRKRFVRTRKQNQIGGLKTSGQRSRKEVRMPHSCIGALSYYYHSLSDYITSDEALRVVEATAAGTAVYRAAWKPLKPLLMPIFITALALMSATKLQRTDASLFAHRMRPCLYPPVLRLPSPEPVTNSPNRDASIGFGKWQASTCRKNSIIMGFCSSPI